MAVEAPKEVAEEAPKVTENGTAIIEDDDEEAKTGGLDLDMEKMRFETFRSILKPWNMRFRENMSLEV